MAIDDIYRAAIAVKVNAINTLNVMHFQLMDDDTSFIAPDLLKDAIEIGLLPLWVPMLSNDTVIESVVITKVLPTPDQPWVYNFSGGTGTVAEEAEPANLGVCFTHYTDNNSKTGRGRNYLCGVAVSLITGSRPTAAFVSLFETFRAKLMSAIPDSAPHLTFRFCHYSPTNNDSDPITHIEQRMQLRLIRGRIGN